jgi:hypothetical protein
LWKGAKVDEETRLQINAINKNLKRMVTLLADMHKTHKEGMEQLLKPQVKINMPEQVFPQGSESGRYEWKKWEQGEIPSDLLKALQRAGVKDHAKLMRTETELAHLQSMQLEAMKLASHTQLLYGNNIIKSDGGS